MAVKTQFSTPTQSQWASAAAHLDRQDEWVWFRVNGERYVSVPSANSNRTYWVRADAAGCSCPFYTRTWNQCAHMLSVYLAATEDELAEQYDEIDAAIEDAFVSLVDMRTLYPGCAGGCSNLADEGRAFCTDCSAKRARDERMAAARKRVVEAWI